MFATQRHGVFAPKIQLKRENFTNAVKLEKCLRYSSIGRCDDNGAEKVETHSEKIEEKNAPDISFRFFALTEGGGGEARSPATEGDLEITMNVVLVIRAHNINGVPHKDYTA